MNSLEVKEYMNHYPVTFTPEMVVEEAALRFLKTKQIGGPVIGKDNKLIGFLSESDVLSKMIETIYYNEHIADVASLMHKEVLTVKPYDSVIELGQQMLKNKPKVYPVVDDNGNLLGTISRNDVLRAIDLHLRSGYPKVK
ncbi:MULTISPECIES: CBS domain-containing protein [unclassified Colwellia]|jgi:CBS domain-containing protein|uniref:CBS domain-containing protein n=1 Tax=unclassified Colwellia TaxID=196834 RepID=UPI000D3A76B2|nr:MULTISPECIES: CBS domain-containing protein [unclassified Colwellia]AWB57314.1 CBS domain-containing protein [Colwellia sp. Arc7-D]MBA6416222.1 CBS domain-containing protein [Colwellia sp. 6M3]|tara:strand:+ start:1392 stop:1811 length:420 start_codon:yes stop_codon:yes gene_type:complete